MKTSFIKFIHATLKNEQGLPLVITVRAHNVQGFHYSPASKTTLVFLNGAQFAVLDTEEQIENAIELALINSETKKEA